MSWLLLAAGPPTSPWTAPEAVTNTVWGWLQIVLYVVLAAAIVSVIVLGAMMALDRDRGQPVSAVSPTVAAFRIALGVLVSTSAVQVAAWFI